MPPALGTEVAQSYLHMKTKKYILTILFCLVCTVAASTAFGQEFPTEANTVKKVTKTPKKETQVPVQNKQALPTPKQAQPVGEPGASTPSFYPQNENEVSAKDLMIRTFSYLALIIGLIFLMGFISKHLLRNGSLSTHKNKKIKVIDSAFIEQKKYVYLVKVMDKAYVMASGANGGLSLIDKIDDVSALNDDKETNSK